MWACCYTGEKIKCNPVQLVLNFEGLSDAVTLHSSVYSYEARFYMYGHYAVYTIRYFTFIQFIHSPSQWPTLRSGKSWARINFLLNDAPFICQSPLHGHQHGLSGLIEQNVMAAFFHAVLLSVWKQLFQAFGKKRKKLQYFLIVPEWHIILYVIAKASSEKYILNKKDTWVSCVCW